MLDRKKYEGNLHRLCTLYTRRINTEEKAKVVAACGTEWIKFLAVLAISHQDD